MGLFNWHRWLRSNVRPKINPYRRRPGWRPFLEYLEDRLSPAKKLFRPAALLKAYSSR